MKRAFPFFCCLLTLLALAGCKPKTKADAPKQEPQVEQEKPKQKEQKAPRIKTIPIGRNYFSKLKALDSYQVNCEGKPYKLDEPILEIGKRLEAKKFKYDAGNLADCSGMFHRFLQEIAVPCSNLIFPKPQEARSSRDLARWFYNNTQFKLIFDAEDQKDLIKPGAIMFYGNSGQAYDNFTADDLFVSGTGINHVGIVVNVEKDAQGNITNYHLFHGRNPRHAAGITTFHTLTPTRKKYPPLGNGRQEWVAFATLSKEIVQ